MPVRHVVLMDRSSHNIPFAELAELAEVAVALQTQVDRDHAFGDEADAVRHDLPRIVTMHAADLVLPRALTTVR